MCQMYECIVFNYRIFDNNPEEFISIEDIHNFPAKC